MSILARGYITISVVNDGYTLSLTSPSVAISADHDGGNPDLSCAETVVSLTKGDMAVDFDISVKPSSDAIEFTVQKIGLTYKINITALPTDITSGYLDIAVVTTDEHQMTVRYTFTVVRSLEDIAWIQDWNGTYTQIGDTYVVTPKIFAGKKETDGSLTGVYMGPLQNFPGEKPEGSVTTEAGIYGYRNNKLVFYIDNSGAQIAGWTISENTLQSDKGGSIKVVGGGQIFIESENTDKGWLMTGGAIKHTLTGLELTAEGTLLVPDMLSLKIGNSTVEGIANNAANSKIGGMNLLENSSFSRDIKGWIDTELETQIKLVGGSYCAQLTSGTLVQEIAGLKTGDVVTVSFDVYRTTSTLTALPIYFSSTGYVVNLSSAALNTWSRVSLTVTLTKDADMIGLAPIPGTTVNVKRIKLERGSVATPYSTKDDMTSRMLMTGIDIIDKKITVTTDQFVIQNNSGQVTASINAEGVLTTNGGVFTNVVVSGEINATSGLFKDVVINGFIRKSKPTIITPANKSEYFTNMWGQVNTFIMDKLSGYLIFQGFTSGTALEIYLPGIRRETGSPAINVGDLTNTSTELFTALSLFGETIVMVNLSSVSIGVTGVLFNLGDDSPTSVPWPPNTIMLLRSVCKDDQYTGYKYLGWERTIIPLS